jgi:glycosyltransferase involved in cell wall biosynthesis
VLVDPPLAARLGAAGRAELERRFTLKRVVGRVEAVYEELPARSPASSSR